MFDALRDRAWQNIQHQWITLLLLGGVIVSWLATLAALKELRDADIIVFAGAIGVGYGALLSATRWRGRTALLVDLLTSLGFALLLVGRVLPDVTAQPFDKTLWLMNGRLSTLLVALRDDVPWLGTNYLPHTRLFLFLNVCVAWNCAVWLWWSVLRRRRALAGLLPLALYLALGTSLSAQGAYLPFLFIVPGVLLIARSSFLYYTRDWDHRRIGFPDLIGEDWSASAAILAGVIIVATGLSTPEWRSTLQRFVESLQPPPPRAQSTPQVIVVDQRATGDYATSFVPSMGYVGESLPQSDQTVFYVETSDPPAGIDSGGVAQPPRQQHYWRGAIYDQYTGTGWEQVAVDTPAPPLSAADPIGPGRYALTQKFDIVALEDNRLFAASQPVQVSQGSTIQMAQADPTARLPRGRTPGYEVVSWAPRVSEQELDADSTAYPAEIVERYLALPASVPQRVADLAARVVQGATSPYDKAVRVQEYLRATYPYKLDVPPPPSRRDVVDYFLFEAPGGFCSYYASAMVVMLRAQGVPARVAVGFGTGEYDGLLRRYRVPAKAAHAWVEVYFPTYGWIEFEPTASMTAFAYSRVATPPDRLPDASQARSAEPVPTVLIALIAVLLLGLSAGSARVWWQQRALARLAPEVQARRLYWQSRRSLVRLGLGAADSVTPAELLEAWAARLAGQPRLWAAVQTVTALYICAAFRSTPPDRSEVAAARQLWRAAWRERARLRWRKMTRPR